MQRQTIIRHLLFACVIAPILAACGSGGSGGGSDCDPKPRIVSSPPRQAIAEQTYIYVTDARWVCLIALCNSVDLTRGPNGATVDDSSDTVSWTPKKTQVNQSFDFEIKTERDTCGDQATQSWEVRVVKDNPPSAPAKLSASENASQGIDLKWRAASDDVGVVGYKIYENGKFLESVTGLTATVKRPAPDDDYCYKVSAFDDAGNESSRSGKSCLSMPTDISVPTAPAFVYADSFENEGEIGIEIEWDGATDDYGISYYKVYRDNTYLGETAEIRFSDDSLDSETEYCYSIITVDAAGKESAPSNEQCETTSWFTVSIPHGYRTPFRASLVVDSMDTLRIAYQASEFDVSTRTYSYTLMSNARAVGSWRWSFPVVIDSNTGTSYGGVGMDIDDSDYLHLGYKKFQALTYATNLSSRWKREPMGPESLNFHSISLGVDSNSAIHVCHSDFYQLIYSTNMTGIWESEDVTATASTFTAISCNLMLDSNDSIHLAYVDQSLKQLMYVTRQSGVWVTEIVAGYADAVHEISSAIDTTGKVHIVYADTASPDLMYATNRSGNWVVVSIDTKAYAEWGSDIAIDQAGAIHISYLDTLNDKVKYATNRSGAWWNYTIDDGSRETAIAIDSNGKVHIVHKGNYSSLMHSTNRNYD